LVGASDIKERLGFTRVQDIHALRRRDPAFPEPVAFIGGGPQHRILVWYWPDVATWARRKGIKVSDAPDSDKPPRPYRNKQVELEAQLAELRKERNELAELREQLGDMADLRKRVEALQVRQERSDADAPDPAADEG
jgi:hypothetical protein